MEFDTLSFILGLILSGVGAGFLFWSEKCSLANRIAYSCCEQARQIILCKRELAETLNPDIENNESIYPIENEEFQIDLLPSKNVQSDVHISRYVGVFSKRYDLWLMIEFTTAFLEEGISDSYVFYFCKPNFDVKQIIKTPYPFNVDKYLIRER